MDKFWKWLEDKHKIKHDEQGAHVFASDGVHVTLARVNLTKQMLIGYMVEFIIDTGIETVKSIESIDKYYTLLEKGIDTEGGTK